MSVEVCELIPDYVGSRCKKNSDKKTEHSLQWLFRYSKMIFYHMITSSNGNIFRSTGLLCGEFTGDRWIPLTKANDAELWCFFFISAWVNGWVNNREAGALMRFRAHYDVTVMNITWYLHWNFTIRRTYVIFFVKNTKQNQTTHVPEKMNSHLNHHNICVSPSMLTNISLALNHRNVPQWPQIQYHQCDHKGCFWVTKYDGTNPHNSHYSSIDHLWLWWYHLSFTVTMTSVQPPTYIMYMLLILNKREFPSRTLRPTLNWVGFV